MKTFLKFKYSTESIGCGEEENFILKFNEDIIADNAEDGEFLVGKATRYMFLLEEAHEAAIPFSIFLIPIRILLILCWKSTTRKKTRSDKI